MSNVKRLARSLRDLDSQRPESKEGKSQIENIQRRLKDDEVVQTLNQNSLARIIKLSSPDQTNGRKEHDDDDDDYSGSSLTWDRVYESLINALELTLRKQLGDANKSHITPQRRSNIIAFVEPLNEVVTRATKDGLYYPAAIILRHISMVFGEFGFHEAIFREYNNMILMLCSSIDHSIHGWGNSIKYLNRLLTRYLNYLSDQENRNSESPRKILLFKTVQKLIHCISQISSLKVERIVKNLEAICDLVEAESSNFEEVIKLFMASIKLNPLDFLPSWLEIGFELLEKLFKKSSQDPTLILNSPNNLELIYALSILFESNHDRRLYLKWSPMLLKLFSFITKHIRKVSKSMTYQGSLTKSPKNRSDNIGTFCKIAAHICHQVYFPVEESKIVTEAGPEELSTLEDFLCYVTSSPPEHISPQVFGILAHIVGMTPTAFAHFPMDDLSKSLMQSLTFYYQKFPSHQLHAAWTMKLMLILDHSNLLHLDEDSLKSLFDLVNSIISFSDAFTDAFWMLFAISSHISTQAFSPFEFLAKYSPNDASAQSACLKAAIFHIKNSRISIKERKHLIAEFYDQHLDSIISRSSSIHLSGLVDVLMALCSNANHNGKPLDNISRPHPSDFLDAPDELSEFSLLERKLKEYNMDFQNDCQLTAPKEYFPSIAQCLDLIISQHIQFANRIFAEEPKTATKTWFKCLTFTALIEIACKERNLFPSSIYPSREAIIHKFSSSYEESFHCLEPLSFLQLQYLTIEKLDHLMPHDLFDTLFQAILSSKDQFKPQLLNLLAMYISVQLVKGPSNDGVGAKIKQFIGEPHENCKNLEIRLDLISKFFKMWKELRRNTKYEEIKPMEGQIIDKVVKFLGSPVFTNQPRLNILKLHNESLKHLADMIDIAKEQTPQSSSMLNSILNNISVKITNCIKGDQKDPVSLEEVNSYLSLIHHTDALYQTKDWNDIAIKLVKKHNLSIWAEMELSEKLASLVAKSLNPRNNDHDINLLSFFTSLINICSELSAHISMRLILRYSLLLAKDCKTCQVLIFHHTLPTLEIKPKPPRFVSKALIAIACRSGFKSLEEFIVYHLHSLIEHWVISAERDIKDFPFTLAGYDSLETLLDRHKSIVLSSYIIAGKVEELDRNYQNWQSEIKTIQPKFLSFLLCEKVADPSDWLRRATKNIRAAVPNCESFLISKDNIARLYLEITKNCMEIKPIHASAASDGFLFHPDSVKHMIKNLAGMKDRGSMKAILDQAIYSVFFSLRNELFSRRYDHEIDRLASGYYLFANFVLDYYGKQDSHKYIPFLLKELTWTWIQLIHRKPTNIAGRLGLDGLSDLILFMQSLKLTPINKRYLRTIFNQLSAISVSESPLKLEAVKLLKKCDGSESFVSQITLVSKNLGLNEPCEPLIWNLASLTKLLAVDNQEEVVLQFSASGSEIISIIKSCLSREPVVKSDSERYPNLLKLVAILIDVCRCSEGRPGLDAMKSLGLLSRALCDITALPQADSEEKSYLQGRYFKKEDDLSETIHFILKKLHRFLWNCDKNLANTSLKATESLLAWVSSSKYCKKVLDSNSDDHSKSHLLDPLFPLLSKGTAEKELRDEIMNEESDDIPASKRYFAKEVASTCLKIIDQQGKGDHFVSYLLPLCRISPEFCESLLPIAVKLLIATGNKEHYTEICGLITKFFQDLRSNTSGLTSEELRNVSLSLDVVQHLRCHENIGNLKPKNPWERNFWIKDVDYLDVAVAALSCSRPYDAILATFLWKTQADAGKKNLTNDDMAVFSDIMIRSFENMGDYDSVFGCFSLPGLDVNKHLKLKLKHEKSWRKLLTFLSMNEDLRLAAEVYQKLNLEQHFHMIVEGLISSQNPTNEELRDIRATSSWRLTKWTFDEKKDIEPKPTFNESLLYSLKCLSIGSSNAHLPMSLEHSLSQSNSLLLGMAKTINPLNCQEIMDYILKIQMMESIIAISKNDNIEDIVRDWEMENRGLVSKEQFEPLIRLRRILLDVKRAPEKIQSDFLNICLTRAKDIGDLAEAKNVIREIVSISHNSSSLKTKAQVEEARIFWMEGEHQIAKNQLKSINSTADNTCPNAKISSLILLGKLLVETKLDTSSSILELFKEAIELGRSHKADASLRMEAAITLSQFADSEYQRLSRYLKSNEYQEKIAFLEKVNHGLKKLDGQDSKEASKGIRVMEKNATMDDQENASLNMEMATFLKTATTNYINCLKLGDQHDLVAFRLIALFFESGDRKDIMQQMEQVINDIPSYKFLPLAYQISARLSLTDDSLGANVVRMMRKLALDHPYHVLPIIMAMSNKANPRQQGVRQPHQEAAEKLMDQLKRFTEVSLSSQRPPKRPRTSASAELGLSAFSNPDGPSFANESYFNLLCSIENLFKAYHELACWNLGKDTLSKKSSKVPSAILMKMNCKSDIPWLSRELPVDKSGKYENQIAITKFCDQVEFCGGINAPKVVKIQTSDGKSYRELAKYSSDDIRQDAVMMQIFYLANSLLQKDEETSKRKLKIRTYKVLPISNLSGVIQWCEGTMPMAEYLAGSPGQKKPGAHQIYHPGDMAPKDCRERMHQEKDSPEDKKKRIFEAICQKIKPAMKYFFLERYPDPRLWLERQIAYTRSVATASIVGYILGIGDRHLSNILIYNDTAEILHIDFGIAFEQGKILPTPERVPFRLTRDIVDGMGVLGVEGVFRVASENVLRLMRRSRDELLTVLDVLLHDPLYAWRLSPDKAAKRQNPKLRMEALKRQEASNSPRLKHEEGSEVHLAERVLARLRQKLDGNEENAILSSEGQVNFLIQQATDAHNLCLMYPGWQPYL